MVSIWLCVVVRSVFILGVGLGVGISVVVRCG